MAVKSSGIQIQSATSSSERAMAAGFYAGSFCLRRVFGLAAFADSWSIGLATEAMMPVATRA
jgi:hypothetical protein